MSRRVLKLENNVVMFILQFISEKLTSHVYAIDVELTRAVLTSIGDLLYTFQSHTENPEKKKSK